MEYYQLKAKVEMADRMFKMGEQSKQAEIDELQKRIESAMELLEYNEYVDSALQALEILKGDQLWNLRML